MPIQGNWHVEKTDTKMFYASPCMGIRCRFRNWLCFVFNILFLTRARAEALALFELRITNLDEGSMPTISRRILAVQLIKSGWLTTFLVKYFFVVVSCVLYPWTKSGWTLTWPKCPWYFIGTGFSLKPYVDTYNSPCSLKDSFEECASVKVLNSLPIKKNSRLTYLAVLV